MNLHSLPSVAPDRIGLSALCDACAMSADELQELMDYGALAPLESAPPEPLFAISYLKPLRTAGRLRRDYDLDLFVVVLVMDYLQRIDQLELQLLHLQVRSGTPQ